MIVTMTSEERAQLVEDIERSANMRRGIAEQARLGHDFDIAAAWEKVEELDAFIDTRIRSTNLPSQSGEALLTAKEFLDTSTKLFADMKLWIEEASKEGAALSASDLAMLNAAVKIVERATLKATEIKPERPN
jgi:hypothetical protein